MEYILKEGKGKGVLYKVSVFCILFYFFSFGRLDAEWIGSLLRHPHFFPYTDSGTSDSGLLLSILCLNIGYGYHLFI